MTDDFEQEVRRMLNERVSALPDSHDVAPENVARARRRRTTRLSALVAIVAVVAIGAVASVAQLANRDSPDRVATSTVTTTSSPTTTVPFARCMVVDDTTRDYTAPDTAPRVPAAGDPAVYAHLASYAATSVSTAVVLGPQGWSCRMSVAKDGNSVLAVYDSRASYTKPYDMFSHMPITIQNDILWDSDASTALSTACEVFELRRYSSQLGPLTCLPPNRVVTPVNDHVSTFVDRDGALGAGWIVRPSSDTAHDGQISVLTCRPTTGLTKADCDTIVADYAARASVLPTTMPTAPTTTAPTTSSTIPPTTTTTPHVLRVAPGTISAPPFPPLSWAATDRGMVISDYDGSSSLAAYDASGDSWVTLPAPPFSSRPTVLAARGNRVFVVGQATDADATTAFAAIDTTTGHWQELARVPEPVTTLVSTPLATAGDASRLFVFGRSNGKVHGKGTPEIALMYDIAANTWTKLPASPLSPRDKPALQWTGTELLVWGGGDLEFGGAARADGAAYNPATGKWRTLPAAPIGANEGAANVWTGTQMLVWGGSNCTLCGGSEVGAGAAYDPATNTWTAMPGSPLLATNLPAGVWTGYEMVVFSCRSSSQATDAAAFDPATNQWRSLPAAPDSVRSMFQANPAAYAAWTGTQAIFGFDTPGGQFAAVDYPIG